MKLHLNKIIRVLSFSFLTVVLFPGCDPGSETAVCHSDSIGVGTTTVAGPSDAAVNETVNLTVAFKVTNDCGSFQLFHKEIETDATVITVNAKYDGCTCGTTDLNRTATYAFKATAPGVYVLKFKATNSTYITHTITVV